MRRASADRLPVLWSLQPPESEVLLEVRQQVNRVIDRAVGNTDGITCAAVVIVHVVGRAAAAHGDVLRPGRLDGPLGSP